ncbi:unnamed protein product [Lathyrus oleraceus]
MANANTFMDEIPGSSQFWWPPLWMVLLADITRWFWQAVCDFTMTRFFNRLSFCICSCELWFSWFDGCVAGTLEHLSWKSNGKGRRPLN